MPYAHKLDVYHDPPHKKIVFCTVCGQDTNLAGPCPGEYVMSPKEQEIFDKDFQRIFGKGA